MTILFFCRESSYLSLFAVSLSRIFLVIKITHHPINMIKYLNSPKISSQMIIIYINSNGIAQLQKNFFCIAVTLPLSPDGNIKNIYILFQIYPCLKVSYIKVYYNCSSKNEQLFLSRNVRQKYRWNQVELQWIETIKVE